MKISLLTTLFLNSIGKKKCKHGMDNSGHCIRV